MPSRASIGQEEFTRAVNSIENAISLSRTDNRQNFDKVFAKLDNHSTRITRLETKQEIDRKKDRRFSIFTAGGLVTVVVGIIEGLHKLQLIP